MTTPERQLMATEEQTRLDARIARVAEMFGNVTLIRRAEVMARREFELVCDGTVDRLRQQADAWVAAIRRGDDEPLTCESPSIPPEKMAEYLKPVIEHFEAELDEARAAAKGNR